MPSKFRQYSRTATASDSAASLALTAYVIRIQLLKLALQIRNMSLNKHALEISEVAISWAIFESYSILWKIRMIVIDSATQCCSGGLGVVSTTVEMKNDRNVADKSFYGTVRFTRILWGERKARDEDERAIYGMRQRQHRTTPLGTKQASASL